MFEIVLFLVQIPHTGQMSSGAGDCSKLYDDIGEHCPNASVTQVSVESDNFTLYAFCCLSIVYIDALAEDF